MKRLAVFIGMVCTLAAPANAQNWSPQCDSHWNINAIQQSLQKRIRTGSQNGSLTRGEVARLQAQFDKINDLERRMRKGGLNAAERNRLDNQLDNLGADIYREKHDGNFLGARPCGWIHTPAYRPRDWDDRRWNSVRWDDRKWEGRYNVNRREDQISDRIHDGRRDGSLTKAEAKDLREEAHSIERAEQRRRADGSLSANDRRALDQRMDNLSSQVHQQRQDGQRSDQDRNAQGRHNQGHHDQGRHKGHHHKD